MPSTPRESPRYRDVFRTAVVPFCTIWFPSVHYLTRNLSTASLYPHVEPTASTYARWGLAALALSTVIGVATGYLVQRVVVVPSNDTNVPTPHPDDPLFWRALLLDGRTLRVYLSFVGVIGLWAVANVAGVGPGTVAALLTLLVVPFALPILLLAPLAIGSHAAVVVGLGAVAPWTAVLARLFVEHVPRARGDRASKEPVD